MRYVSTIEQIGIEDSQIEIARCLLQEGVAMDIIARSTKLSIERLKELQKQLEQSNCSDPQY
jgi:hypothetical protein